MGFADRDGRSFGDAVWQPAGFLLLASIVGVGTAKLPLVWAIALVVAAILLLLIFVNPLVGLGLAILAGPFGALENVVFGSGSVASGQLLLLITASVWLAGGLVRRRVMLPHTRLNVPLAFFTGLMAWTISDAVSIELGLKELLKWIEIGLIMLMLVDLTKRMGLTAARARQFALAAVLLSGLSQAVVGIWQFGVRGDGPEHFGIPGGFYRAYGTFEQPNPFAGFVSLTAFLALGAFSGLVIQRIRSFGVDRPNRKLGSIDRPKKGWSAAFWFTGVGACAALCSMAVVFSWSRGAWLGFGVGLAVIAFFLPKRTGHGLAVVIIAVLLGTGLFVAGNALGVLPADLVQRITNINQGVALGDVRGIDINDANFSVLERLAHWQAAIDMARENLWSGVGFGGYEAAYAEYALINWPEALGHAHNYYLNLLAESGLPGLFAYVLLWGIVFWQTIRMIRILDWPERGIAIGLMAAWAAFSVHHLVDKLYVNNIYFQLGVMFGLLYLLNEPDEEEKEATLMHWRAA